MKRIKLLVAGLAVVLSLLPSTVLAAGPYTESVFGIETGFAAGGCGAAGDQSTFAGTATGTINGAFQIAVCHTPLTPNATITGGTYTVTNATTTLNGDFPPGGSVTQLDGTRNLGSLCIQQYTVIGALTPAGSGFTGKLTHVGLADEGSCNVFFAFITGTAFITGP
jgi:hypothetical protein